jgi:hypothetical protein
MADSPQLCHQHFAREIKCNLKQLQKGLRKHTVCDKLLLVALDPFENLQIATETISYRKRRYLQTLLFEISDQINNKEPVATEQICKLLLRLNYNNVRFFNYYTQHMEMTSKDLESSKELVELLFIEDENAAAGANKFFHRL